MTLLVQKFWGEKKLSVFDYLETKIIKIQKNPMAIKLEGGSINKR